MRFALILVISAIIFTGCRLQPKEIEEPISTKQIAEMELHNLKIDDLEMVEWEGCEYLIFKDSRGNLGFGFMTHKGNCKNPIHCYNNTNTSSNSE